MTCLVTRDLRRTPLCAQYIRNDNEQLGEYVLFVFIVAENAQEPWFLMYVCDCSGCDNYIIDFIIGS